MQEAFPRGPFAAIAPAPCGPRLVQFHEMPLEPQAALEAYLDEGDEDLGWTEEDVVHLHWRLLQELRRLADADTPLADKIELLSWALSEPDKAQRPFSFEACLKAVGNSPLSPTPFFGELDAQVIRDWIRNHARGWLEDGLARYPEWTRDLVYRQPGLVADRLRANPQWLNEQVLARTRSLQSDLFFRQ